MRAEDRAIAVVHISGVLAVVALYSLMGRLVVPEGVNHAFLLHLSRLSVLLACFVVLAGMFSGLRAALRSPAVVLARGRNDIARSDLLLLLLPLTPVAQYILLNQDVLHPAWSVLLLLAAGALAFLACFAVPVLLSRALPADAVMIAGLALMYVLFGMASFSAQFEWHRTGAFPVQLAMFTAVAALLWILRVAGRSMSRLLVALFFFGTVGLNLFAVADGISGDVSSVVEAQEHGAAEDQPGITLKRQANVYFLTYESYANDIAMAHYGIDNGEQLEWLAANGFEVYPHAHTLASASVTSVSRLFAMDMQLEKEPRAYIAGDSPVHSVFRNNGYETYGIFPQDYLIQNVPVHYDHHFPEESDPLGQLVLAIAEGEFRFDVSYDTVEYGEYLEEKRRALEKPAARKFLYTHNRLPAHSQNSGRCLDDEVAHYESRLREANVEMRLDLEALLAADPDAIIVVAGDHGPYLTKNCMFLERARLDIGEIERIDIQDRLGVLLAIRWPDWVEREPCDIRTLQDVYPAIFAALAEDRSLLDLRPDQPSLEQGLGGVVVQGGYLVGGRHDGEPLFESGCHWWTGEGRYSPRSVGFEAN